MTADNSAVSGGKVVAWVDSRDLKERESFEVLACSDKYKGITQHELRYDTPLVLQSDLAAAIARAEAAERDAAMFRRVMAIGKLPVRCSTGYYYSDGVIHPTPEAAIAAQQEPQS